MQALEIPRRLLDGLQARKTQIPSFDTPLERERWAADLFNRTTEGHLTGADCPKCRNRGYFMRVDDNCRRYNQECECMTTRRNMRLIRESGLSEMLERYTFDAWKCQEPWQRSMLELAKKYAERPSGWFYVAGRTGTGKTHICTAMCGELMRHSYETRYMLWRDMTTRALKNFRQDYERLIDPLKSVRVLYIDDFLKTGGNVEPNREEASLAWDIVNSRCNDSHLVTVISSEWTLVKMRDFDESLASRIREKAKGHIADLSQKENWRMK